MAANVDPYRLQRYLDAQAPVYAAVVAELAAGRKESHWMWFVFPQLEGLGHSATARRFALRSRQEAEAYWRHPLLGARLKECTALLLRVPDKSAHEILGSPDDLKLHSCLTLFALVATDEPLFTDALGRFFEARPDERTLALLR